MLRKLNDILSHGEGVAVWVASTIGALMSGYEGMIFLLLFVVVVDALWGIANAVKAGKFVLSDLMRNTVGKILSYCSVFLVIVGIEKVVGIESGICSAVVVGVIALTEVWSISGHIMIRFPNLLFFRLFRPALIGEIARKLQISEDEVKEMFNENKTKNGNTDSKTVQKRNVHNRKNAD